MGGYDLYLLAIAELLNNKYLRLFSFYFHTLIQQRLIMITQTLYNKNAFHVAQQNVSILWSTEIKSAVKRKSASAEWRK